MRLVFVEWVDSMSVATKWCEIEDIPAPTEHGLICQTVGWIVHDTKVAYTLVGSRATGGSESSWLNAIDGITIPKCAVKRIQDIRSLSQRKRSKKR